MRGFTLVGLALVGATMVSANPTAAPTIEEEGAAPKSPVANTPAEAGMVHPVAVLMDNGDVVPIPTMAPEYADEAMYGPEYGDADMGLHFDPYGENSPFPVGEYGPDGFPPGEEPLSDLDEGAAQRSMFARRGYGGGYGGYGAIYGAGYGSIYPGTINGYGKWGGKGGNWKLRGGKKYGGYATAQMYGGGGLLNKPIINTPIINKPVINKPIVNRPIFNKPSFPYPTPLPTLPPLPTFPVEPPMPTLPPLPQIPVSLPATYEVQPAYTYPQYDPVYGQPDCPPGQSCGGTVTPMYMPRRSVVTSSGGYTRPSYSKYVH